MMRKPETLTNRVFDVLVVGGGIHGALNAWDAALRGLSVALIDRGDFGSATSQNSLKIIHGGLRYLQDGSLSRIRKMAKERTTWMQVAPHLVHPFTCLMPTQNKLTRGRLAMTAALAVNDILSYDRNRLADKEKTLPGGKVISRQEVARLLPGYDTSRSTGAAVWHDAQIYSSERLVLEFVLSAARAGAAVANYVEATGLVKEGSRIVGVTARDTLTGKSLEIQAKVVINCAGAWIDGLLEKVESQSGFATSIAMNVVVDQIWPGVAAGIPSRPGGGRPSQVLFAAPWRGKTIIGTWHIHWNKPPDQFELQESTVQAFIEEINSAHPRLGLTLKDVRHVSWGFLPVRNENAQRERVKLSRDDQVIDHQERDKLDGLVSVVSVKFTTARATAEQAVDLAVKKLAGQDGPRSRTSTTPVDGGHIEDFFDYLQTARVTAPPGIDASVLEHLVYSYGSRHGDLLDCIRENPEWGEPVHPFKPVTPAEIIHAVRNEMAVTLLDVVQRRTELGAAGLPSLPTLQQAADVMAREAGWSPGQQQQEIGNVVRAYPFH